MMLLELLGTRLRSNVAIGRPTRTPAAITASHRRTATRRLVRRAPGTVAAFMLTLAAVTALTQAAGARPAASQPAAAVIPPLGPPRPLKLPAIAQRQLPNGLRILILEDHRQPAIWLRLAIGGGSSRDPRGREGLAQMEAGMLDKGTATRSQAQIADTIDGLGASLGASADLDYWTVSASGLSSHTDTIFDLLSDVTLHPAFPAQELERQRVQTVSSIVSSLGRPAVVAEAALRRRVFGGHPYGEFASGTTKTVNAITQQDLVDMHDRLFAPNNATLFVVGDITADQALEKARSRFGKWQRREVSEAPSEPSSTDSAGGVQITIVDRPGAAQTEVRLGLPTAGYRDPLRSVSRVASAVLGLGQFEGRLTREIRVKRGLTYGAASFFDRKGQAGVFEIETFTKNASTGEVVKIALHEARRMQTELTPAEELNDRKEFLNGSFAVSVATTPGVLQRLVPAVLYGGGPEELTRYTSDTEAVTSGQIESYMKSLPLDKIQVVLVGDAAAVRPQVESLGHVTVIPPDALDLESPTLMREGSSGAAAAAPTAEQAEMGKTRLAATVAALGGDAFLNTRSVILKGDGEITPPGQDNPVPIASATLTFAQPARSRFELNTGFGDVIFGSDGTNSAWLSALGSVQDAPDFGFRDPTDLIRQATQKKLDARAVTDLRDPVTGVTLQGFSLTDTRNRTVRVYVDPKSQLPARVAIASGQGALEIALGDYHKTADVNLPGLLKVTQGGKMFISLKFNAWDVNKAVDEKLFQRPKG